MSARLVFVDRDGVINRDSDAYIKSVDEWQALPGSLEAIAELTAAGFKVVVVTNQSGIGRKLFSEATLAEIHAAMTRAVEAAGGKIAGIYYCPHRPDEACECRKPKPKLLLDAAADFAVPIAETTFIGDKASDVGAAMAAGARPVLVGTRTASAEFPDVLRFTDLAAAVRHLIAEVPR